jgi:hypothetical protein
MLIILRSEEGGSYGKVSFYQRNNCRLIAQGNIESKFIWKITLMRVELHRLIPFLHGGSNASVELSITLAAHNVHEFLPQKVLGLLRMLLDTRASNAHFMLVTLRTD